MATEVERVRVLVVEDDAVARAVLRHAIEKSDDLELVGEAATALDGISLARKIQPDVVILDHQLPGERFATTPMQGIEAIDHLKSGTSAKVIFHTSHPTVEPAARRAGADAFLLKGETPARLLAIIRQLAN